VLTGDPVTGPRRARAVPDDRTWPGRLHRRLPQVVHARSLGLRSGAKLAGQTVVGAIFAVLALRFPDGYGLTPASLHLSFLTDVGFSIGPAGRKPRSWCASG
jgi:hypothetical protein